MMIVKFWASISHLGSICEKGKFIFIRFIRLLPNKPNLAYIGYVQAQGKTNFGMEPNQQQYVEETGLFFESIGLSQTIGRIMGWLLVCEPPHQTLDEICGALEMAKSTISTTIRTMQQFGMVERVSVRGDRKHYYRVRDSFWVDSFERSLVQFQGFREMAEKGLDLLHESDDKQRERLQKMLDIYTFLEREFPKMLAAWHAKNNRSRDKGDQDD